ncbi:MAG: PROBABLE SIGNAL PEPTIDE PROTEIN, partial [uncultured Solirubrobacteraceae bacterium]
AALAQEEVQEEEGRCEAVQDRAPEERAQEEGLQARAEEAQDAAEGRQGQARADPEGASRAAGPVGRRAAARRAARFARTAARAGPAERDPARVADAGRLDAQPQERRAPAVARRLRTASRPGRGARGHRSPRRRRGADPRLRRRAAHRLGPARRERQPARPRERLGSRPLLVARPHGPLRAPARRADDPHLARLVRDARRRPGPSARPERDDAQARARLVRGARARDDDRPGDADVPQRDRQPQGPSERELRPRVDGALHTRCRPRRVHRDRRARDRPGAHRLARGLERGGGDAQLPLRPQPLRRDLEDAVGGHAARAQGRVRLARRGEALPREPVPPVVLRSQAVELLHPHAAEPRDAGRARGGLPQQRLPDPARRRGHPAPPRPLRGPAAGQAAGRLHGWPAACPQPDDHDDRLGVAVPQRRPAAVPPAERQRLERPGLARHGDAARALVHRLRGPQPRVPAAGLVQHDRDGRAGARRRACALGPPDALERDARRARPLRPGLRPVHPRLLAAGVVPRLPPERAAPPHRHLPRLPGLL